MGQSSVNAVFGNAVATIWSDGLSGCGFVSNAWVYLKFYGVDAYSPFYYNGTMELYPRDTVQRHGSGAAIPPHRQQFHCLALCKLLDSAA